MNPSIIKTVLIAAALLLCASLSFAAENKSGPATETKAVSNAKTTQKSTKAKVGKAAAKVKLVDINSAGKAELKTLPGVSDAAADQIIARRPYLTKADLVTEKIVSPGIYGQLKSRVFAKQNKAAAAKLEKLKKERTSR